MDNKIRISEIFGPTIQGEGALIGQPTVFIRTGGCDYRCDWCDTPYAVDSTHRHTWQPMTAEDIFTKVRKLSGDQPIMISLSGGNPAIQPLAPLLTLGKSYGYSFMLETQGSIVQDWFANLDFLTLSPKPPSSKMQTDWHRLDDCVKAADKTKTILKFVIFDDADYDYARGAAARYPGLPIYLQPCNATPPPASIKLDDVMQRMRWLIEKTIADQWYEAIVLPQLHVLIWGNQRGV